MGNMSFQEWFSDNREINYWDDIYHRQDSFGLCVRQRLNIALSYLEYSLSSKNTVCLDAGCGAGTAVNEIAKKGHNVIGMDLSHGMLKRSINNCNGVEKAPMFLQGDIEKLPFKDSSLDTILCLGVFTYLSFAYNALGELSRVLKPNGELVVSIINKYRLVNRLDLPLLLKHNVQKGYRTRRSYTLASFIKSLHRQGFVILENTSIPHGIFTFCGKEIRPINLNMKIAFFIEKFSNVPFVGSFGGLCLFRARKISDCSLS